MKQRIKRCMRKKGNDPSVDGGDRRREVLQSVGFVLLTTLLCTSLCGCPYVSSQGINPADDKMTADSTGGDQTSAMSNSGTDSSDSQKTETGDTTEAEKKTDTVKSDWLNRSISTKGDVLRLTYTIVGGETGEEKPGKDDVLTVEYHQNGTVRCEYPIDTTTEYAPDGSFTLTDPNKLCLKVSDEETVSVTFPDETVLLKRMDGRTTLRFADGICVTYGKGSPIVWQSEDNRPPLYRYSVENAEEIPLKELFVSASTESGVKTFLQSFPNGAVMAFKLTDGVQTVRVEAYYPNGAFLYDDGQGNLRFGYRSENSLLRYNKANEQQSIVSAWAEREITFHDGDKTVYPGDANGSISVERTKGASPNQDIITIRYPIGLESRVQGGKVQQELNETKRDYSAPPQSDPQTPARPTSKTEIENAAANDLENSSNSENSPYMTPAGENLPSGQSGAGKTSEGRPFTASTDLVVQIVALVMLCVAVGGIVVFVLYRKKHRSLEESRSDKFHSNNSDSTSYENPGTAQNKTLGDRNDNSPNSYNADGYNNHEKNDLYAGSFRRSYLGYYVDSPVSRGKGRVLFEEKDSGVLFTKDDLTRMQRIKVYPKMGLDASGTSEDGTINERDLENGLLISECFEIRNSEHYSGQVLRIHVGKPAVMKLSWNANNGRYLYELDAKGVILVQGVNGQ